MEIPSTGVRAVNELTEPKVINAIKEAKEKGWELFPKDLLDRNATEWKKKLEQGIEGLPDEYLKIAKQEAEYLPIRHMTHPAYLADALDKGFIPSINSREGKGRTSKYEKVLGLGDYVFLSDPQWSAAPGISLYFSPESIFKEGTVVTLGDWVYLSGAPFDDRVKFYQKTAFSGPDFKEMLPYFLVAHFGNLKNPDRERNHDVSDFYPDSYLQDWGDEQIFKFEVKVKDKLPLVGDFKALSTNESAYPYLEKMFEMNDGDLARLYKKLGNHVVDHKFDTGTDIDDFIKLGRRLWDNDN